MIFRLVARLSSLLGRILLPFGVFSVVAVGLHIGCDRMDDHLYVGLNILDGWADALAETILRAVGAAFHAQSTTVESLVYRAQDYVDVAAKHALARMVALGWELTVDVLLAVPVFRFCLTPARSRASDVSFGAAPSGSPDRLARLSSTRVWWQQCWAEISQKPWRDLRQEVSRRLRVWWTTAPFSSALARLRRAMADFTLLKWVGLAAVLMTLLAGALAVSSECETLAHASLRRLAASLFVSRSPVLSSALGLVVLFLLLTRLGTPALRSVAVWADARATRARASGLSPLRRGLRGVLVTVVIFPVAALAGAQALDGLRHLWSRFLG